VKEGKKKKKSDNVKKIKRGNFVIFWVHCFII